MTGRIMGLCALLAATALAGCGQPDAVAKDAGTTVRISSGGDSGAQLPAYAPPYPGADMVTQIRSDSAGRVGGGVVMVMVTTDSPEKVIAFYDGKARAAGVKANLVTSEAGGATRIFGDRAQGKGAMVMVRTREEGGTEVTVAAGAEPGPPAGHAPGMVPAMKGKLQ